MAAEPQGVDGVDVVIAEFGRVAALVELFDPNHVVGGVGTHDPAGDVAAPF